MATNERRFLTGFLTVDSDEPGLVIEGDGVTYVVEADGTRTALPGSGGTGCDALDCSDPDAAVLQTVNVLLIGQPPAAGDASEAYLAAQDEDGHTRAALDATLNTGQTVAQARVVAQDTSAAQAASLTLRVDDGDGYSTGVLDADRVHFNGGAAIVRPTFDLSSGTAAQLAQALADLGIITVVP